MEFNLNITKLQGIFRHLLETVGDLSRIRYKGGNEEKIQQIIENNKDYFILKNFLINNKANPNFFQELEYIVALLIVNTDFKSVTSLSNIKQFSHFIKAIPLLSKCVLVNIIIELDLVKHCCSVVSMLPYTVGQEVFDEFISCSKHCEPPKLLSDSYIILDTIIKMLINLDAEKDQQDGETIDKLGDVTVEMLKNVCHINEEWAHKMKTKHVHEHMGYTLFYFFKLLRTCPLYISNLIRVIQALIDVSIKLVMLITLSIYCAWAEIKYDDDQPMQIVIAGEAYMVIEHLNKHKSAKHLIEMLGPMARKPKTINEIILEADVDTIIANIDKGDENQKLWLRGLINSNVFKNEQASNCLDKWAHLCTQDDVMRLLSLSVHHKEHTVKMLVLKCAKVLSIQELEFVTTRYFCEYNTNNLDTGLVIQEFTTLINNTQSGSEVDDEFIKSLYLLLLQNPEAVLSVLYSECLRANTYASYLKKAFTSIKTSVEVIHGLPKNTLIKVFKSNPPTSENFVCYKSLLGMLLELHFFNTHAILNEVFKPQLEELLNEGNYEILLYVLQLLNVISIEHTLHKNILEVIALLGKILEATRCAFVNFSLVQQSIVQEVTDLLSRYRSSSKLQQNIQFKDYLANLKIQNLMNRFHITNLYQSQENQFLSCVYPQLRISNNVDDVSILIKILPSCVTSEWNLIVKEMDSYYDNYATLLSRFEDTLTLFGKTAIQTKYPHMQNAVKYYLQQYGIIIKDILQPKYSTLNEEVVLIKSVCNTLKEIPINIRETDGLQLISLFSSNALRSLKTDKKFVMSVVALNDSIISQIVAQKVLATD